ncbi:MAG: hypothetical protein RXR70_00670 [Acidilobus sp.]|jgi:hypothetical protein
MKEQWLTTTDGSLLLGLASLIIDVVESNCEDPLTAMVTSEVLDENHLKEGMKRGLLEVHLKPARVEPKELVYRGVKVFFTEGREGLIAIRELYERLPIKVLSLDYFSLYSRLAKRTAESGVEYMIVYTEDGEALVFEGEKFRASLPGVRSVPALVHTHPAGHCGLSRKDVESGLELMMDRGLMVAAVTEDACAAIMYRVGLLDEEDLLKAKEGTLGGLNSVKFVRVNLV